MGDIADILIQDGLEHMCQGCGRDQEYCECDPELQDMPESINVNQARPKKHQDGCPAKLVRRRNRWTGVEFVGCRSFPKCKFSRSLTPAEEGARGLR